MEIDEGLILTAPGIRTAVIRISPADLAGFIRVIDSGRAGPGHLNGHRFAENALVDIRAGGA